MAKYITTARLSRGDVDFIEDMIDFLSDLIDGVVSEDDEDDDGGDDGIDFLAVEDDDE